MISLLVDYLPTFGFILGLLLSYLTLTFLIRLILSWYPKIDINKRVWLPVTLPTSSILHITRKVIPPIGGVDVSPVIWIGIVSFLREILVGQQGLINIAIQQNLN